MCSMKVKAMKNDSHWLWQIYGLKDFLLRQLFCTVTCVSTASEIQERIKINESGILLKKASIKTYCYFTFFHFKI